MRENKIFFFYVLMKIRYFNNGFYFYSIKIQTNTKKNSIKKDERKSYIF